MTDTPILENDRRLTDRVAGMSRAEVIRLVIKLCEIVSEQAGEDGFRGGVRPGNVSLGEDGSVALGPGGRPQRDKWSAEELEFLAPEQFWNDESDARSDVYSLGLLLYYCLSGGKLPFQEDDEPQAAEKAELMRRRMAGEPISAPAAAGKSLGAIIEKATSFEAERRYAEASDMPFVLNLCLKELEKVKAPEAAEIFNKDETELSDVEKMMVGIIGRAAEDAALSGDDEPEDSPEEAGGEEIPGDAGAFGEESPEEPTVVITPVPGDAAPEAAEEEPTVIVGAVTEEQETPRPVLEEAEAGEEAAPPAADEPEEAVLPEEPQKTEEAAPERPAVRPVVQYNMPNETPPEPPKKKNRKPVMVVILLCAAIIVLAIVIKSFLTPQTVTPNDPIITAPSSSAQVSDRVSAAPGESGEPEESAKPTPTAEPTPTMTPNVSTEPTYELITADVSWTEAERLCEEKGGHLVVIDSQEKFDMVTSLAVEKGVRFVWLGCYRAADGSMKWVNSADIDFYKWGAGEPSVTESDGTPEDYVLLWNTKSDLSGIWQYNDVGNDPVSIYPRGYSGKIAYICEIDG